MSDQWQYQLRVYLTGEFIEPARDAHDPALGALAEILHEHNATIKCQFDAFAGYVAEAEAQGVEGFPLYEWTKATIEDPLKRAKHLKSFAIHVEGREVYPKETADALEAALQPLLGGEIITAISKHDTNPANSPQPPARYRNKAAS
jgi:hypothetical protein